MKENDTLKVILQIAKYHNELLIVYCLKLPFERRNRLLVKNTFQIFFNQQTKSSCNNECWFDKILHKIIIVAKCNNNCTYVIVFMNITCKFVSN